MKFLLFMLLILVILFVLLFLLMGEPSNEGIEPSIRQTDSIGASISIEESDSIIGITIPDGTIGIKVADNLYIDSNGDLKIGITIP